MPKLLFSLLLLISSTFLPQSKASSWSPGRIIEILPEGEIYLNTERPAKLAGIDYEAFNSTDECFRRVVLKRLRDSWIDLPIQYRHDHTKLLIKHTKHGNLSEFILRNGMGRLNEEHLSSYYKGKFRTATQSAQEQNIGIWRGCGRDQNRRKVRALRQKLFFMDQFEGFLAPISSGKVTKVLTGDLIEMENGAKVKLLGLALPQKTKKLKNLKPENSKELIEDCFSSQSRQFLQSLILGRRVFLRADRVDFDQQGRLLRYVYLPSWKKNTDEMLINQHMIQQGYAKSYWHGKNEYFKKSFNEIQEQVYQNPRGAWHSCTHQVLNAQSDTQKEAKAMIYDESCRIKGNISGTKTNPIKKYHTPLSPWYNRITKPERCFESTEEAEKAGFVKVK